MNGLESNGYQSHIFLYNKGVSTTQENGSSLVDCCGKDAARMWLDYLILEFGIKSVCKQFQLP